MKRPPPRPKRAPPAQAPVRVPPPLVRPDRPEAAAPAQAERPSEQLTHGDKIVAFYRTNLQPDRHELARLIYGDSTQASMINLQQTLQRLCIAGRLKRVGHGKYEVAK